MYIWWALSECVQRGYMSHSFDQHIQFIYWFNVITISQHYSSTTETVSWEQYFALMKYGETFLRYSFLYVLPAASLAFCNDSEICLFPLSVLVVEAFSNSICEILLVPAGLLICWDRVHQSSCYSCWWNLLFIVVACGHISERIFLSCRFCNLSPHRAWPLLEEAEVELQLMGEIVVEYQER